YHRSMPSFPTRRSSDLALVAFLAENDEAPHGAARRVHHAKEAVFLCRMLGVAPVQVGGVPCARDVAQGGTGELQRIESRVCARRSEEHTSELQSRENLV